MKQTYVLTVEVDEKNIEEKYPNWHLNHRNAEEFGKWLAKTKEEITYEYDGKVKSMWTEFGYRVRVKKI